MNTHRTSRLAQFFRRSTAERQDVIREWLGLDAGAPLPTGGGLTLGEADNMIENVIGTYALPFAVGTNFVVNGRDYLIPMVIEEPSVVAAVSNAAKLFREGGGFVTSSDEPVMIGQIQVLDVPDMAGAMQNIRRELDSLLRQADEVGGSIVKRGGGARDIEMREFGDTASGPMLVLHLLYDTRDAMGANAINTAVEHIAPQVEALTGGRVNLRILSNLSDRRLARAEGRVPVDSLARGDLSGAEVARAIVEAGVFAEVDPYRAATHNKGIMNGIDAVVLATGNDWRAVEAGAHAFAARDGRYSSLTRWRLSDAGDLYGSIELPLAVGIVGGATRVHPMAQLALEILDVESARELAEVMAAVGLAQNFAAMRALATEGIQHGHMRMHARQLAVAAGAAPELVAVVVRRLIDGGTIRLEEARVIVEELRREQT